MPYASWGLRLGGWLIDFVILAVVQGILNLALRKNGPLTLHYTMTNQGVVHHNHVSFLALILGILITLGYQHHPHRQRGQDGRHDGGWCALCA